MGKGLNFNEGKPTVPLQQFKDASVFFFARVCVCVRDRVIAFEVRGKHAV